MTIFRYLHCHFKASRISSLIYLSVPPSKFLSHRNHGKDDFMDGMDKNNYGVQTTIGIASGEDSDTSGAR